MERLGRIGAVLLVAALGCGNSSTNGTSDAGLVPYEPLSAVASPTADGSPVSLASPPVTSGPDASLGLFSVRMVDAPVVDPHVEEVWVAVESVTAHVAGQGWVKIHSWASPFSVDLLTLQDGAAAQLGLLALPAGTITQIRLLIARDATAGVGSDILNYVVLDTGEHVPLKVPSGYESGIKIIGPWTVVGCTHTEVTIDFDGKKSIWYHPTGHDDEWILRPVIRVQGTVTGPSSCDGTPPSDGGTPPGKPLGDSCTAGAECASGTCTNSVCVTPGENPGPPPTDGGGAAPGTKVFGDACTNGGDCASGSCLNGTCGGNSAGTNCTADGECVSNLCFYGYCAVSPQGGSCNVTGDCATGTTCAAATCSNPTGKAIGDTCGAASECASNNCSAGTCQPGFQGASCSTQADCATGLTCVTDPVLHSSTCQPMQPQ